jgi:hypothetical protein
MYFFRFFFTFCSARVSALVIVLIDSPCERIGKWAYPMIQKLFPNNDAIFLTIMPKFTQL